MLILGIDTSGHTASVALCDEEKVIVQNTVYTKLTHSQVILPLVEKALSDADLKLSDIDGFAVANGPGSYTGLRIGISAVKAMCFALSKKCIGISTLESLAYNCVACKGVILSIMKARPDISYFGIYQSNGEKLLKLCSDGIEATESVFQRLPADKDIILVGDGALDFYNTYKDKNAHLRLSPLHLRLQLASSLCAVAQQEELLSPDYLDASYLQITKAEKEIKTNTTKGEKQ